MIRNRKLKLAAALWLTAVPTLWPWVRSTRDLRLMFLSQYRGEGAAQPGSKSVGDLKLQAVYQDEQLQNLIRTALERNYDLRIAAERVIQARAQLGITGPTSCRLLVSAQAIFSTRQVGNKQIPAIEVEAGSVSANFFWELDFWGKFRKATEAGARRAPSYRMGTPSGDQFPHLRCRHLLPAAARHRPATGDHAEDSRVSEGIASSDSDSC